MNKPALVVMARAPQAGRVKTRLQPALTPAECAGLYQAFLQDVMELALSMKEYAPFLAFTPPESWPVFESMTPPGTELIPQTGNDLGQVMDNLIKTFTKREFVPVVLIGSDIPTIQPDTLRRALNVLKSSDVCFGPSSDGGYYLVGANRPVPEIFQHILWSTSAVLKLSQEYAHKVGISVGLLEELCDVDTIDDLKTLKTAIIELHSKSNVRIPAHTEAWLENRVAESRGRREG